MINVRDSIFTRDTTALSKLVEEARLKYIAVSQPHVTVYQATMGGVSHFVILPDFDSF